MKVSAQYAEDHFKEILATAASGEEIEIASEGKDSFKLLYIPAPPPKNQGQRILGAGVGELQVPTDKEWRAMKEEDARHWDDASLITTGEI
jgi:antitoxin (DNA-binding transcriptional repressor) of toxin-antitoxin stability system